VVNTKCPSCCFLTTRDEFHPDITMKWINKNIDNVRFSIGAPNAELYMASVYQDRNNMELKSNFLSPILLNKYNVISIFDSIPENINRWTNNRFNSLDTK
jgi:hypothetical protein